MKATHDVSKLPQWAQREISRLTRDLEYANGKLAAGPDNSDTFADPYSDAPRPLGQGTTIQFGTERGARIRVKLEEGRLEVAGDNQLLIEPRVSNAIRITSGRI